ncbi:hypothetical protein GCM10020258_08500 [Sphingomonas yabuuchiae]
MNAKADYQHDPADGGALRFTGSLSLATLGDLPERLDREDSTVRRIDLSQVDRIDTVGAWLIHRFAARNDAAIDGLDDDQRHLFAKVTEADQPVAMRPKPVSPSRAWRARSAMRWSPPSRRCTACSASWARPCSPGWR